MSISYIVKKFKDRFETTFFKNDIEVVKITHYHGFYPYISWKDKWYRFDSFYFRLYAFSYKEGKIVNF